jgi:1-acyl-sn-glycerol-3-phosphate acyltransferase
LAFIPALLSVIINLIVLLIMALLMPKLTRKLELPLIRFWGRAPLAFFGIRVEVHQQHIRTNPGAKILLFNHINIFDLFVLSATWTQGSSVIYKKEFHNVPIMGRLMKFFGMISVDRHDRGAALKSVCLAAKEINEHQSTVVMAPEGTRSSTGKLAAFKKGPFHLALQTQAPVVPMIMRGLDVLAPNGTLFPRPGTVRVDYLEEIPTNDWDRTSLHSHIEHVREKFLLYLPDGTSKQPRSPD